MRGVNMRFIRLMLAPLAIATSSANAETSGLPKALVCSFSRGSFSTVEGLGFKTTSAGSLEFTIAAINEKLSSAQIVGNVGASELLLVAGHETASFIEITPIGNVNLT
jgi:hypothetical protein